MNLDTSNKLDSLGKNIHSNDEAGSPDLLDKEIYTDDQILGTSINLNVDASNKLDLLAENIPSDDKVVSSDLLDKKIYTDDQITDTSHLNVHSSNRLDLLFEDITSINEAEYNSSLHNETAVVYQILHEESNMNLSPDNLFTL